MKSLHASEPRIQRSTFSLCIRQLFAGSWTNALQEELARNY